MNLLFRVPKGKLEGAVRLGAAEVGTEEEALRTDRWERPRGAEGDLGAPRACWGFHIAVLSEIPLGLHLDCL